MKVTSRLHSDGKIVIGLVSESNHEETLLRILARAERPTAWLAEFANTIADDGVELSLTFAPKTHENDLLPESAQSAGGNIGERPLV